MKKMILYFNLWYYFVNWFNYFCNIQNVFADIWSKNADKLNRNLCKYEIKKVKAYTLEILERIYHLSGIHFIPLNQMYLLKNI